MTNWEPVPEWPGYFVNQDGDVMSRRQSKSGRILSPNTNWSGYLMVYPRKNGKTYGRLVHRLVAAAFLGPQPTSDHEINHKNGDKLDNRACNLEWVTHSQNQAHAVATGLYQRGEQRPMSKLTRDQAAEIKRRSAMGEACSSIAKDYPVSESSIWRVARGGGWRHVMPSASQPKPEGGDGE